MLGCRAGNFSISLKQQSKQQQQKALIVMLAHPGDSVRWIISLFGSFPSLQLLDVIYMQWHYLCRLWAFWHRIRRHYHWGQILRYFDETLATSLFPAGSLFLCNRIGLCPLFPVGWGWEASKGYAELSTLMPDHLPTKRTLFWHQRDCMFVTFLLLCWAERWQAIFGFNIASWWISHLTVTATEINTARLSTSQQKSFDKTL